MQKIAGKYRQTGDVFGILYKSGTGLIVESHCGWEHAQWNYYELVNSKLIVKFNIDVKYRKPVRQEVERIKINIQK